jgi:hypothetical protein
MFTDYTAPGVSFCNVLKINEQKLCGTAKTYLLCKVFNKLCKDVELLISMTTVCIYRSFLLCVYFGEELNVLPIKSNQPIMDKFASKLWYPEDTVRLILDLGMSYAKAPFINLVILTSKLTVSSYKVM